MPFSSKGKEEINEVNGTDQPQIISKVNTDFFNFRASKNKASF
jgi:hypothetical protein